MQHVPLRVGVRRNRAGRPTVDWRDDTGAATAEGRSLHAALERRTDELAIEPWGAVENDALEHLVTTLAHLAGRIAAAGVIRFPNPMGLPAPS